MNKVRIVIRWEGSHHDDVYSVAHYLGEYSADQNTVVSAVMNGLDKVDPTEVDTTGYSYHSHRYIIADLGLSRYHIYIQADVYEVTEEGELTYSSGADVDEYQLPVLGSSYEPLEEDVGDLKAIAGVTPIELVKHIQRFCAKMGNRGGMLGI